MNTCKMLAQADKWWLGSSYKQLVKAALRKTLGTREVTVGYKAAQQGQRAMDGKHALLHTHCFTLTSLLT